MEVSEILLESKSKILNYSTIEGSPYINNNTGANNNLPIGKFYSTKFKYIETALARYNAFTDNMEVSLMEDGVDYNLLKKQSDFLYIMLGRKTYRAYKYDYAIGFFVILSENDQGRCTLLKKEKIVFKKEEKASNSYLTDTADSFSRKKNALYFKLDNGIKEIPKKKKHLHNLFVEKNSEMKEFIGSTKLRLSKEEDLLRISKYYNSLFD